MTRPDPVLEKWLQEQERKLLRAQTDMTRIMQQPRRGSAGEALLFDATDILVRPLDPTNGINDFPMYNAPPVWKLTINEVFPHLNNPANYVYGGASVSEMRDFMGTHTLDRVPSGTSLLLDTLFDWQQPNFAAVWRKDMGLSIPAGVTGCDISFVEIVIVYDQAIYPSNCGSGDVSNGPVIQFVASCGFTKSDGSRAGDPPVIVTHNVNYGFETLPLIPGITSTETDTSSSRCYNFTSRRDVRTKGSMTWQGIATSNISNDVHCLVTL